jgi:PadR family transcriptional regulator, regulatory protein PadR
VREPTYFILAALAEEPRHGYAIAQAIARLSGGRVSPTAGTLYGALERLTAEGLVEIAGEETVDGRRRRYHRLSEAGAEALLAENAHRLESAQRVQSVLRARPA